MKKETKEGTYHPLVHLLASTIIQIPMMILLSIFAITISGYAIGHWNMSSYLSMVFMFAAVFWSFECAGQCLAVANANPLLGMLNLMNFWFAAFLFCGMIIPEDDVIMPLRLLCSLSPMKWGISNIVYLEFSGTTWAGAEASALSPYGFACTDPKLDPRACFGHTGDQILKSLSVAYSVVSPEDNIWRNLMIILLISLSFKLVFATIFLVKCSVGRQIVDVDVAQKLAWNHPIDAGGGGNVDDKCVDNAAAVVPQEECSDDVVIF